MSYKASIIILTYNQLEDATKPCIESLYNHTDPEDFELILVDNDSKDGSPEFLKDLKSKYSNVKIQLNKTNRGFAGGNNDGFQLAQGEIIILLNNDTLVTDNWLNKLVGVLEKNPAMGIVGPVSNSVGNEQKINLDGLTENNFAEISNAYCERHRDFLFETEKLGFFCVAIRREVFDKIGLLDENFGIGMFEDDDFCVRARSNGYKLGVIEDCFVYHKGSFSFKKLDKEDYQSLFQKNKEYFIRKHKTDWCYSDILSAYFHKLSNDLNFYKSTEKKVADPIDRILARIQDFRNLIYFIKTIETGGSNVHATSSKDILLQEKHKQLMELSEWATALKKELQDKDAQVAEKNKKLLELSEWATALKKELQVKDALVAEKNKKLLEVSEWATDLKKELQEKAAQVAEKNKKLLEVSDWATSLKKELQVKDAQVAEKNKKLLEVSEWATSLKNDNLEKQSRLNLIRKNLDEISVKASLFKEANEKKDVLLSEKHKKLMEISDWALNQKGQLQAKEQLLAKYHHRIQNLEYRNKIMDAELNLIKASRSYKLINKIKRIKIW